jgi:AraC-like DNA-binding protein
MPLSLKHFFAKPPLKRPLFRVSGLGVRERMPAVLVNRPAGTEGFLMMYFHTPVQAGASADCGWIKGGHLYIWLPADPQFYGNANRAFLHSWILCHGTLIAGMMRGIPSKKPIPLPSPHVFLRFLTDLYRELTSYSSPNEAIAGNLCENWLLDLKRSLPARPAAQIPERLLSAQEFMDVHFTQKLTLVQVASIAHWSPTQFSAHFRQHYGTSPMNYVIRLRMKLAAYLVSDLNRSITEIAASVGYEDLYHFSKLFKKYHGLSPSAMRRT